MSVAYLRLRSALAILRFEARALALFAGEPSRTRSSSRSDAAGDRSGASRPGRSTVGGGQRPQYDVVLVAAFLVFCMQVGFVMLEAGFARSRESINILVEGIVDTCICGVTFWAWGFAFMFEPGNGFIGTTGFFLKGLADTYGTTGVPLLAFWVFQFAFADTCSTITSGAMVGRCGFIGDILYSIGVTGFIYPIIGHWAWGPDGWLAVMAGAVPRLRRARPSCTPSAARFRSPARSRSGRGSAACSGATAAVRRCRTTSSSARSAA